MIGKPVYSQDISNPERVWKVKIEGNETFDGLVIKDVISNEPPSLLKKMVFWKKVGMRLNENEVRRDVIRIERFYKRRGFNDVIVSYRIKDLNKEWKKAVIFEVVENIPIIIRNVDFIVETSREDSTIVFNDERFKSIARSLPYREGRRYETVVQPEVEGNLIGALKNLGYPYAGSEVTAEIDTAAKSAQVKILSKLGPRARFDSVLVEGEENLDQKYIIRETGIKKGELFSEDKLREAQREVFSHHMLRFALVSIPDQPEDSTINMKVRVKETALRSIQIRFGIANFSRLEGVQDFYKLFRGQVDWTHRSMRGRGERLTLTTHVSAIEQRLGSDYLFPYLFNTKSSLVLSPFAEHKLEPSYEIIRGGITNSFIYQYSSNLTGTVSYEFTLNNETTSSGHENLPDSIQSYNISSFNLNAYYAKNYRRGSKGWSFQPFYELSGLFGESTYSFQKAGVDVRKFSPLGDNVVFAKRVYMSGIYHSREDSLPSDVRFYNGGTNSVRGWLRNELGPKRPEFDEEDKFERFVPVGGRASFSFNAEFRFRLHELIKGLGFATFLDGGQVWREFSDIGTTPIQYGLGGGIRYQSPIGPIRVDLAYKLNPTNEDLRIYQGQNYGNKWDRWGIHFSIGQAF